jgi:hypothetical protein
MFEFFPHLDDIKWRHAKVSHFFDFFWISYARFRARIKMTTPGSEFRFYGKSLVKKWHVSDPKMIFAKNQELVLLELKGKPMSVSAKSVGACVKSRKQLWRFARWNESWYMYPRWSIIYVGFCAQLSVCRFGSCLTKKPISALQKWKTHFSWDKTKIGLCDVPHHPKGHACVWYGLVSTNYAMIGVKPSSFNLKAMQPRMW